MAIPRFSEILASRRRELGLTTAQASRVLKLREDVLLAFENGDYGHMPQSGYAQGMLSSYARYLGLNAREIVDLFTEELYEYQHGTSSHELRRRTRHTQSGRIISGYETPNEVESRPKAYVEYRPLLPSGGGPAGDLGDFATTAPARPRMSVPLAGAGTAAPGTRGYTGAPAREDERPGRRGSGRPYNAPSARERESSSTSRRRPPASRRRGIDQTARLDGARGYPARGTRGADGAVYMRDDVSTRRVRAGEYTDDLRLDGEARPSVSAATASGRRSSRNIANVERPNVRRRAPRAQSDGSRGRRPPARGGLVGQFLSDPRRALFALILLLAVVLTAVLVFSVSSCVNARNQPATGQVVPVQSTDGTQSDDDGAAGDNDATDSDEPAADAADDSEGKDADAEPAEGADDAAAEDGKDAKADEPTETVVEVSVAEGSVSWVEITCDGKSEVAESVTGPWTKSYTVEDSISIQVANPDAVTVTKNGEKVALSQRAGGLGSVKIDGTPAAKADASADGSTADEGE